MTDHDDDLLAELKRVVGTADPVPPSVLEAARAVLDWRLADSILAELAYDSALDDRPLAGVRHGGGGPRMLSFEEAGLTIEVEVHPARETARLVGQLVPAVEAVLTVRHHGGEDDVEVDGRGRFRVEGVASGPLQLVVRLAEGRTVQTASVVI